MKSKLFLTLLAACCAAGLFAQSQAQASAQPAPQAGTARATPEGVFVDGKPFQFLAGEIHYFRVLPQYWRDSLEKLRACGLNTVSTYCPWNAHEPKRGEFDFSGALNLRAFLQQCQDLGLKVMLRPGPYICSEWDFGGFPWWLLLDKNMCIRSLDPLYFNPASAYMKRILKEAEPYFCNNGGPIVAIQIENGYASYGNDIKYLEALRDIVLDSGFKGIIYTADGDSKTRLNALNVKGVWRTLMCGGNLPAALSIMKTLQPNMPQMIGELWCGQLIRYNSPMGVENLPLMCARLDEVLSSGAGVALYMFHGGTNFWFMNGAGRTMEPGTYLPFISSYDSAAPLDEAGCLTPKYFAFRDVFLKHNPQAAKYPVPQNPKRRAYGAIKFDEYAPIAENIANLTAKTASSFRPLSMEEMGHPQGLIHYATRIAKPLFPLDVRILGVRDYAVAYFNGRKLASFTQNDADASFKIDVPDGGGDLEILVENQGRVNYSLTMSENRKGITGGVVINNQQFQCNWTMRSLPLDSLAKLKWGKVPAKPGAIKYPAFFRAKFNVDTPIFTLAKACAAFAG